MTAYYNEFDPFAAAWLRELIAAGLIAPGEVDERSIEDVRPRDLDGFTQCHFFAGIGVWSYALRRAGWEDSWPVWTMSCPCQPFSAAGAGAGFADERHLWPAAFQLIAQRQPPIVFGEQVASKIAEPWLDLVQTDVEALGYAFGSVPFPSAGVGAPHIRDRLFWVGNAHESGLERFGGDIRPRADGSQRFDQLPRQANLAGWPTPTARDFKGRSGAGRQERKGNIREHAAERGGFGGLADSTGGGRREERAHFGRVAAGDREKENAAGFVSGGSGGGLADLHSNRRDQARKCEPAAGSDGPFGDRGAPAGEPATGPTNGFWRDADWLFCRDGKWRPVEPGTFPLVDGAPARVGRLRGYGNAINAEAAIAFIEAAIDAGVSMA